MAHPENLLIVGGLLLTACSSPDQKPKTPPAFSGEAGPNVVNFYPGSEEGVFDAISETGDTLTVGQGVTALDNAYRRAGTSMIDPNVCANIAKESAGNLGLLKGTPGTPSNLWETVATGGPIHLSTAPTVQVIKEWVRGKPVEKKMTNACGPKNREALKKLQQKPAAKPAVTTVPAAESKSEIPPVANAVDTRWGGLGVAALIGLVTWLLRNKLGIDEGKKPPELVPNPGSRLNTESRQPTRSALGSASKAPGAVSPQNGIGTVRPVSEADLKKMVAPTVDKRMSELMVQQSRTGGQDFLAEWVGDYRRKYEEEEILKLIRSGVLKK